MEVKVSNLLSTLYKDKPLYSLTVGEFQALMSELMPANSLEPKEIKPIEDKDYSIAELAKHLRVSESTIHRYKNNGSIPYYKVSRTVFFKRSEVEAALTSQPKKKGNKA